MSDNKKAVLGIVIISLCIILFLGRKFFWSSPQKGEIQEGENALLSNEETDQLLSKIENLLGESTSSREKRTAMGGEDRTVYPWLEQRKIKQGGRTDEAVRESGNRDAGAQSHKKEVGGGRPQGMRISRSTNFAQSRGKMASSREKINTSQRKTDYSGESAFQVLESDPYLSLLEVIDRIKNNNNEDMREKSDFLAFSYTDFQPYFYGRNDNSSNDDEPMDEEPANEQDTKFQELTPTPWSSDFFGSVDAEEGSWVCAYTREGKLCGKAMVKKDGRYGVLHIYQDDPTTKEKEGVRPGEPIIFEVNGRRTSTWGPHKAECPVSTSELRQVDLKIES